MRLTKILSTFICIIMLIVCTACSTGYNNFDSALNDTTMLYEIPAVNSTIIKNDELIWDSKYDSNTRYDSIYCIGSISKSFVAILSLILEQEGKISLDDTIGDYLSNTVLQNKNKVTLRDLLTMRSGIADYFIDFDKEDYFKEYRIDELINMGMSHSAFLKQGDFNYSNTNILIAKQMIEKATGLACEKLIKEKILVPLGLTNTFFVTDKQTIYNKIIVGYSNTKTENRIDFTNTTTSWSDVACGMYSTSIDMAKWGNFIINSSIISDSSRKELFNFIETDNEINYGLCIIQKQVNEKNVFILQGNVPGIVLLYIFLIIQC